MVIAHHRRAGFRHPAACHRGGARGGAARRDEVPAAGRHAGAEGSGAAQVRARPRARVSRSTQIVVGNGGKQVLFDALHGDRRRGRRGDDPGAVLVRLCADDAVVGGEPVFVNCPQNNGFRCAPEDLDAAITPRTKLADAEFPEQSRSGAACGRARICARSPRCMLRHPHVWIMSDDMYEHLVYGEVRVRPRWRRWSRGCATGC